MTSFIDFLNSHQDFFNNGDCYTITQHSVDNNGSERTVTYPMKHDTCGLNDVSFGNWSEMSNGGETHITMLLPSSSKMEEITCDKGLNRCDLNSYTLGSGTFSSDEQEVTFTMIPDEKNPSQKFSSIKIHRL